MTKILVSRVMVEIIDGLAPLNNQLRIERDPLLKIEKMWEMGKIIDWYIRKYKLKLHELLYQIYDPHSTIKTSNITRDLGSYSYRIYKYFNKKDGIRKSFPNLKSYFLFREAVPLLFNKVYAHVNKDKILTLLNSNLSNRNITETLSKIKQGIKLIKNPRTQKAHLYQEEGDFINRLVLELKGIYASSEAFPIEHEVDNIIGDRDYRKVLVKILLALSADTFIKGIQDISTQSLPNSILKLFQIAQGRNIDRSRFRKWVLSTNKLLSLAEGIQALDDKDSYNFYRKKHLS